LTTRDDQVLVCVVEIPKGTRNKYEFNPNLGGIKFDRLLMSAATYPTRRQMAPMGPDSAANWTS